MDPLNFFKQFLYEAPNEDPPDVSSPPEEDTGPPDIPEESSSDEAPPDIGDDGGGDMDEAPPDLGDGDFSDDYGSDDMGSENGNGEDLKLNEKISAILNEQLYKKFLSLINNINGELSKIQNNSDVLNIISKDSLNIVDQLKKLDENINLYLKYNFINEDYSKNLLFFNKCINLLKLLNDIFSNETNKGIKAIE